MIETDKENLQLERQRMREMVDELSKIEEQLMDWEIKFVNNLNAWTGDFTPRQKATLIRMYNKHFSRF